MLHPSESHIRTENAVAVIGMSGRFATSRSIEDFWTRLLCGETLISCASAEELEAAGLPERVRSHPDFVPAAGTVPEPGLFDAEFFGLSPGEAEITDPQQRHLLEHCWSALEIAGYGNAETRGSVGVFVSVSRNDYRARVQRDPYDSIERMTAAIGNDPDMAATRVSYKLNLTGPSSTILTACSSSLVGLHAACQSLLTDECDMALCGGASVRRFEASGYSYRQGGIFSPDGRCRPFDAKAAGTVPGDGVGVVLLKRLEDALQDGDTIHAVVLGTAVNNDGARKAGFTAPSTEGQKAVIRQALANAELGPEDIHYIEAHGTATQLGDPIEFQALREVFAPRAGRADCLIGSVKGNVGHLDAAAGICGFIKAVLAVEHAAIPPTLHYQAPNPALALEGSGLAFLGAKTGWPVMDARRVAAVSSFGIGGTNAHVIVGQAPDRATPDAVSAGPQILALAAKTPAALSNMRSDLADALEARPQVPLPFVAATLRRRDMSMAYRDAVVASDPTAAARALRNADRDAAGAEALAGAEAPRLIFVLQGQGAHVLGLGAGLFERDPVFRSAFVECEAILQPLTGWRLRDVAFDTAADAAACMTRTLYAQPVVFSLGYALARSLEGRGLRPDAMIGHSLGEFLAACLSGVFSLNTALEVVAERARIFDACPEGRMISVALSEADTEAYTGHGVSLACVNSASQCTLAGSPEAITSAAKAFKRNGIAAQQLSTTRAFHCDLIEPALKEFRDVLARAKLQAPRVNFVSNVTGRNILPEEAVSPNYWVRQARSVVRFHDGIKTLTAPAKPATFLEIGAPSGLLTRVRASDVRSTALLARSAAGPEDEQAAMLKAIAKLWKAGHAADLRSDPSRPDATIVIPLPTYPFERRNYLLPPVHSDTVAQSVKTGTANAREAVPHDGEANGSAAWDPAEVWPGDPVAQRVARVWAEVLKAPRILPDDDFFDLGGNSLLAVQIVTRLREDFAGLEMSAIFHAPTVDLLAKGIRNGRGGADGDGDDELAELLEEFGDLDEAEIERMLEKTND
jgi:phthiocerol/phenolphthiocerol synthesis type-I polyketide synthase E